MTPLSRWFVQVSKSINIVRICVSAPTVLFVRHKSRFFPRSTTMGSDIFCFSDYDCIGFDLDSTLCHYKITNNVKLIYGIMSRYLVDVKDYNSSQLYKPVDEDLDLLQKGLILDLKKGNILKLDDCGLINHAWHGTRMLTEKELLSNYGPKKEWKYATEYVNSMLDSWNGLSSENIRALLDYYDVSASIAFSRCVQTLDETGKQNEYRVWPDILDCLVYMFSREHYSMDKGEFFPALKHSPELYYQKCDSSVINFLRELKKQNKIIFVITGSNVDYANHTGSYCMGPNWNELFDFVVYYARKPGFFVGNRPFYKTLDFREEEVIDPSEMTIGNGIGYSQGNWDTLYHVMQKHLHKKPRCVYIGDNLLQDIYTPSFAQKCDTIVINEEMTAEGVPGNFESHPDETILNSKYWGSYYTMQNFSGVHMPTLWASIIRKHSKICIPNLEIVAKLPIDYEYLTFSENRFCKAGFHPGPPMLLPE